MKKMQKLLIIAVLCLSMGVAGASAYKIFAAQQEYDAGVDVYKEIGKAFPAGNIEQEENTEKDPAGEPKEYILAEPGDFTVLKGINPQVYAWILGPGAGISYPVVQGEDNEYYLNHLFNGTKNSSGCLFVDCRNTAGFNNRNTIIYGHNMKNGTMFSGLTKYKKQAFYDSNPIIYLMTEDKVYHIELFAGVLATVEDKAWTLKFKDDQAFLDWVAWAKSKSTFQSEVEVGAGDKVVSLSTCAYDFEDARYVVYGRLVEQETENNAGQQP